MSRILAIVAVVVIVASTLAAGPALAAKGGKGGNGGHGGNTTATLTVSPNPVPLGAPYLISGCGYTYGKSVALVTVYPDGHGSVIGVAVGTDGCISQNDPGETIAGNYELDTYQDLGGRSWTLLATRPFAVQ